MKVVILAGGFGTRISEETDLIPKPMIEIAGKPMLWHVMKIYSQYGFNDFIILLGYKGYVIKEYFANYFLHQSNITIDLSKNVTNVHNNMCEPWKVTLIDTGLNTMTGGRIKQVSDYIKGERFFLTYGDGVSNINLKELLQFHISNGKYLTVTAIQPEGRFGALNINNKSVVTSFLEKPIGDGNWINGGFFVCEPEVMNYITDSNNIIFEREPMENLAHDNQMVAYKHTGYWKCMDTLRDKIQLEKLWNEDKAEWKIWE